MRRHLKSMLASCADGGGGAAGGGTLTGAGVVRQAAEHAKKILVRMYVTDVTGV